MPTRNNKQPKGFTIIEVVLVLAVASLIILIVLGALPQLQKSRRDSNRKSDVQELATYITEYSTSTNVLPTTDIFIQAMGGSSNAFSEYISNRDGDIVFTDPSTGVGYTSATALSDSSTEGEYVYNTGYECDSGNTGTSSTGIASDFALLIQLENGRYCVDNVN